VRVLLSYSVKRFVTWVDRLNPEKKHAVKYIDALLKERKKASTIGNILYMLKCYYSIIGRELDLKLPKQQVASFMRLAPV
jgi:hypothetical protein